MSLEDWIPVSSPRYVHCQLCRDTLKRTAHNLPHFFLTHTPLQRTSLEAPSAGNEAFNTNELSLNCFIKVKLWKKLCHFNGSLILIESMSSHKAAKRIFLANLRIRREPLNNTLDALTLLTNKRRADFRWNIALNYIRQAPLDKNLFKTYKVKPRIRGCCHRILYFILT